MSDENFFREVNEEIRQDRTRALWSSYGKLLIAAAVIAVVGAVGYVVWSEYQVAEANASGDRFLAAVELASAGNLSQSLTEFEALAEDGHGAYRDLARMRVATVHEAQGDPAAAVADFDAIAGDGGAPDAIRDMAAVRAAYILVDTGSVDDVRQRVERLSGDGEPLRYAAREALGTAEWKAGNLAEAKRFFEQLSADQGTPAGIGLRTRVMLDLIAAGTTPATAAAAAVTTPPAIAEPVTPASALPAAPVLPEMSAPVAAPQTPPSETPAAEPAPPAAPPSASPDPAG